MEDFEIFINIILYLLLALAFFSGYLEGDVFLLFIFGIIAVLCLTLAKISNNKNENKWEDKRWGYFFIAPFILFFLFVLTKLFYGKIFPDKEMREGIHFLLDFGNIILKLIKWESMWAILIIMVLIFCWINKKKVVNAIINALLAISLVILSLFSNYPNNMYIFLGSILVSVYASYWIWKEYG